MLYLLGILSYGTAIAISWYLVTVNMKRDEPKLYEPRNIIVGFISIISIVLFWIASGSFWKAMAWIMITGIGYLLIGALITYLYMRKRSIHLGYREP